MVQGAQERLEGVLVLGMLLVSSLKLFLFCLDCGLRSLVFLASSFLVDHKIPIYKAFLLRNICVLALFPKMLIRPPTKYFLKLNYKNV